MTEPKLPCPLTVVGGFLGAGKTTLINHLLATATGRYAVLVNDFGAINIDADLIAEHAGDTIRLTNGCVCCSLADSFVDTLIRVLDGAMPFDQMIIEASGVGDPYAIAEIALVEPQLVLNAVVVLVDAERIAALLADARLGNTVARQIRVADILLLNKADLVDADAMRQSQKALRAIKPGVRILETVGAAASDDVLGLGPAPDRAARLFRADAAAHEETFKRVLYRSDGCFDRAQLAVILDGLPPSVLRLKGICRLMEADMPVLLQMVGSRWSMVERPGLPARGYAVELVAIGTADMPSEAVFRDLLDAALAGRAAA